MNIFALLVQGDSATWSDDPAKLPDGRQADFAAGWQLLYALRGPSTLDLTGAAPTATPAGWQTTLSAASCQQLAVGLYAWAAYVSRGAERLTVGSGQLKIEPDLAAVTAPIDARSTAQRALQACEAAMATFNATGGKIKRYEIAGRTMEFQTIGELMQLHSFWAMKVASEQTASSLAQGLGNPRNLYVRFVRP